MEDLKKLQGDLLSFQRRRTHGMRYPESLRERVGGWVVERRQRGDLMIDIVRELGVPINVDTLVRWWASEYQPVAMVPVEVAGSLGSPLGGIAVVTPMGVRVEGLTINEADRDSEDAPMILGTSRAVRVFAYPKTGWSTRGCANFATLVRNRLAA